MRRKLWLLLILFLSLVGRESCCASSASARVQIQEQNIGQSQGQNKGIGLAGAVLWWCIVVVLNGVVYWYFDLHQKKEGWYTCKFYYAAGYRTKLFYNRIYLDFFSSFPKMILGLRRYGLLALVGCLFFININVRIYHDFYIVFAIPVLHCLHEIFLFFKTRFPSQGHKDN